MHIINNGSTDEESFKALYIIIGTSVRVMFSGTIGPVDEDDVIQEVSIKVWLYWQTHTIYHPQAFIRRVTYHVISDMQRHFKPSLFQELPCDESGAINESALPTSCLLLEEDPEWIVMQKENYDVCLNRLVDAIAVLYKHQKHVMICTLKARMDGWSHLSAVLEARGISTDAEWPDDTTEKKRLQASLSPARRNITRHII